MIWYLHDKGFLWHEHELIDKRFPYNESVEVPMLLRWPRHLEPGTVDRDVVGIIDVAPTIYEITGIQPDHNLDGQSVLSGHRTHILTEYGAPPRSRSRPGARSGVQTACTSSIPNPVKPNTIRRRIPGSWIMRRRMGPRPRALRI
jgi:N-sulfoglucosamine sulfohydrolase-like protein